jgi:hypothetical protein
MACELGGYKSWIGLMACELSGLQVIDRLDGM